MNIVHVTHTDLDGYGCGWLMNEFVKTKPLVKMTQINSDYHSLTKDLQDIVDHYNGINKLRCEVPYVMVESIDMLVITDLNLKREQALIIKQLVDIGAIKTVVFVDHHISDEATLDVIRDLPLQTKADVIVDTSMSATKLLYRYLSEIDVDIRANANFAAAVEFVNAWDIHDFTNEMTFDKGQLLNDLFFEMKMAIPNNAFDKSIEQKMIYTIYTLFGNPHHLSPSVDCSKIEGRMRSALPKYCFETVYKTTDMSRAEKDHAMNLIRQYGFKQAMSLVIAYAMQEYAQDPHYLRRDEVSGMNVFIPKNILPMSVVHHIIYTLQLADVVAIIRPHQKVELRQHSDSVYNLGQVAIHCGGGGHRNAAGFPQSHNDYPVDTREVIFNFLSKQSSKLEERLAS